MIVLGLHFEHDAGATLMKDGEIAISIEAERVTGQKHDEGLPAIHAAISAALSQTGIRAEDIDAVAYSDLWGSDFHHKKLDRRSDIQARTHGPRLAADIGSVRDNGFDTLIPADVARLRPDIPVLTICHSISHAASALYMSGFADAAGLVIDGYGTCCGMMGYTYRNGVLTRLEPFKDRFLLGAGYHRIGVLAHEIARTTHLDVAGKVMGLCAYGAARPDWVQFFREKFFSSSAETGYDDYLAGFTRFDPKAVQPASAPATGLEICADLFPGGIIKGTTTVDDKHYLSLVSSMQEAFTQIVSGTVKEIVDTTGDSNVFLSGGCSLNIIANSAVAALPGISSVFVPPNASDTGQAMGAAIAGMQAMTGIPLHRAEISSHVRGNPFIGSALLDDPAAATLPEGIFRAAFSWSDASDLTMLARRFINGQIIGVVAGASEIGPRALGNRSILALASYPQMKDIINQKIKRREWWRPFAPVCRHQDAGTYFRMRAPSRYMLMNDEVREEWRGPLSSITHKDNTCRLQTIGEREENPKLWDLFEQLKKEGAIPVLLNTSFNLSRKPLVNSTAEALLLLADSKMDAVVFQDHIFYKEVWKEEAGMIDRLAEVQRAGESVPGFRTGIQAEELIKLSYNLEGDPVIVEIGSLFGRGAAYLAGARRLRGSGMVHTVDPFDNSGDDFAVSHYNRLLAAAGYGPGSNRQCFDDNIARLGLQDWVKAHQGRQQDIAAGWKQPIDFLFFDGDQSPEGVRSAYDNWAPFLKKGGILAVSNSGERDYPPGQEGSFLLVQQEVVPEKYSDIRLIWLLTVARKL